MINDLNPLEDFIRKGLSFNLIENKENVFMDIDITKEHREKAKYLDDTIKSNVITQENSTSSTQNTFQTDLQQSILEPSIAENHVQ